MFLVWNFELLELFFVEQGNIQIFLDQSQTTDIDWLLW